MGGILLAFGWVGGELLVGPGGGVLGCLTAGGVWSFLTALSFFQGDAMLLRSSGAHEVTPELHPELFNVVEEMKIASGLKTMPKVYIIDDPGLNAFAAGARQDKSSIAVTAGLLTRLDRDELQGVVAHEMAHILNRDVLYMTLAGVMLGSLQMLSQMVTRGLWHGGARGSDRRYRSSSSSSSGSGGSQALLAVAVIVLAIVGPILAQIFYFSLSRKREYLADATGARLTRYPEGLASALEKISGRSALASANSATAPMFIERPEDPSRRAAVGLLSTHPPIEKRIAILRSMSGAGYAAYSEAAKKILNGDAVVPASALQSAESSAARTAPVSRPVGLGRFAPRETGDLIRAVNGFVFVNCSCGLKLKLPPEFRHPTVACPKCSRTLPVPGQGRGASPETTRSASAEKPSVPSGWRTLGCASCGHAITLSPAFSSPYAVCRNCGGKNPL